MKKHVYEYQARNRYFALVRGRVKADSEKEAKCKIKNRGFMFPHIWLFGQRPVAVLGAHFEGNALAQYQLDGFTLCSADDKYLIFVSNSYAAKLPGVLLLLGGACLLWMSYKRTLDYGLLAIGIVLALIGLVSILSKGKMIVDGHEKKIIICFSAGPVQFCQKISLGRKVFTVSPNPYRAYVVCLVLADGEEVQLDANSSEKLEHELGTEIAKHLDIPFIVSNFE